MQAKITQSFLAALSLIGILALPSAASAHGEDSYNNRREVQREFHNSPYNNREHLRLQRSLRHNYQDHYDQHSYNDDHSGNRWYGGQRQYGNRYSRGDGCKWPRRSYGNGRQYRPRYYGNDYYGYTR